MGTYFWEALTALLSPGMSLPDRSWGASNKLLNGILACIFPDLFSLDFRLSTLTDYYGHNLTQRCQNHDCLMCSDNGMILRLLLL